MASLADFRDRFPELASYGDTIVGVMLDEAAAEAEPAIFEGRIDLAILYLAAHLLTFSTGAGAAAAAGVKSVTAGPASVTFGDAAAAIASTGATAYGKRYKELARQNTGAQAI